MTTPVIFSPRASLVLGTRHYFTLEEYRYRITNPKSKLNGCTVIVPKFTLSDGLTLPPTIHAMIDPWGNHTDAVIAHDYLCNYLTVYKGEGVVRITRAQADDVFLDVMKDTGVGKIKALTLWSAVTAYRGLSSLTSGKVHKPTYSENKGKLELEARKAGRPLL